jgi:antitoxin component HigA of HigAB toxin-antitoxin module
MYILYKEPGQFLGTVVPIYTCDGRQICQVNDDTFNYLKGNVKVLEDRMVRKGAPNYGKVDIKYYTNGLDKSDLDYQTSSVWTDEKFTTKMHREYTEDEFNAAIGLQKIILTANVEDVFDVRFKALSKNKPEMEASTWSAQSKEANAYKADNTVDTPVLSKLADTRGLTVDALADKIITKEAEYNIAVAELLGQQQKLIDEIKACTQIWELLKWNEDNFGVQAPISNIKEHFPDMIDENNVRKAPVEHSIKF